MSAPKLSDATSATAPVLSPGGFFMLPLDLVQRLTDIGCKSALPCILIASRLDLATHHPGRGSKPPHGATQSEVAEACGMDKKTVQRHLRHLLTLGCVHEVRAAGGSRGAKYAYENAYRRRDGHEGATHGPRPLAADRPQEYEQAGHAELTDIHCAMPSSEGDGRIADRAWPVVSVPGSRPDLARSSAASPEPSDPASPNSDLLPIQEVPCSGCSGPAYARGTALTYCDDCETGAA